MRAVSLSSDTAREARANGRLNNAMPPVWRCLWIDDHGSMCGSMMFRRQIEDHMAKHGLKQTDAEQYCVEVPSDMLTANQIRSARTETKTRCTGAEQQIIIVALDAYERVCTLNKTWDSDKEMFCSARKELREAIEGTR